MTPATRLMVVLLLGIVTVSLGWTVSVYDGNGKTFVLGILGPDELLRVDESLGAAGLNDYEIVGGNRLRVPASQKARYLQALSDGNAIPASWGEEISESLESGFLEPLSITDRKYQVSRERMFEKTLCKRPQIDFAHVEFDELKSGFTQESKSVCLIQVQRAGNRAVDTAILKSIAEAAPAYFAGLDPKNVRVVDISTSYSYSPNQLDHVAGDNPLLSAKAAWEDYYDQKASEVLKEYGDVKVSVCVELDHTLFEEKELRRFTPGNSQSESLRSHKRVERHIPPHADPSSEGSLNQPQSLLSVDETEETTRNQYGHEAVVTHRAGLNPKAVKISIGIPESYYRKVHALRWRLDNPGSDEMGTIIPSEQELARIRADVHQAVRSAVENLPFATASENDQPLINIYAFTDFPPPELPGRSFAENATDWVSKSWSTLALISIVLVSLGLMSFWIRSAPLRRAPERHLSDELALQIPDGQQDEVQISRTELSADVSATEIDTYKQDLSRLVKENPQAAQDLLKNWMREAA